MGSCKDGLSDLKRIRRAPERSRELGHFLGSRGGSWWFVFISAVPGADCHMNPTSGRCLSLGPQPRTSALATRKAQVLCCGCRGWAPRFRYSRDEMS